MDAERVPTPDSPKAKSEWAGRITRVVAGQVRVWRERRGLSAQQLADRTKELGYQVPRSVIANLENDRRDTVGVAEILILAAALDIPPTLLLTAVGEAEMVEILPEIEASPWPARGWILGARYPAYPSFSLANWNEAKRAIALYDVHRTLVNEHRQIENRIRRLAGHEQLEPEDAALSEGILRQRRSALAQAIHDLALSVQRIRDQESLIKTEGFLVPELPPAVALMVRTPRSPEPSDIDRSERSRNDPFSALMHDLISHLERPGRDSRPQAGQ